MITRFLDQYENELTDQDVSALTRLFEMDDTVLLDVLLARSEPEGQYATPDIQRLVDIMRKL
jgi:antitoxin CptB